MLDTTPDPNGGTNTDPNANTQDESMRRYQGLQKVLAKRDADLASLTDMLDKANAAAAEAQAALAPFREKADAEQAEAQALQDYETLKARFEDAKPPLVGNSPQRVDGWLRERKPEDTYQGRERTGTSSGWPT